MIARLAILSHNSPYMKEGESYSDKLERALEGQKKYLDQTALPELKSKFETMRNTFSNLHSLFLKKSLVREDPYKEEQKQSEIILPPNTEVAEIEKADQVGMRLSMFDNQLDFLLQYYQFTIDFLTLKRIKLLVGLTTFVNWNNVSTTSTHINTRLLAEMIGKIRGSSDTFSIQVINSVQDQLVELSADISRPLKQLTSYHRERYKLEVRRAVIEMLKLSPEAVSAKRAAIIDLIKKRFAESMQRMPYYDDLIKEILDEDYGADSATRQEAVLNKLSITERKKVKKKQVDFRALLLEAVRLLSASGKPLERALAKLNENGNIVEEYRQKHDSPFRRWINRLLGQKKEQRVYEISVVDPTTAVAKGISVNFDDFYKKGIQTARLIASYSSKMNASYARLDAMDEEEIYTLLERNITEIQHMARLLPVLHSYFQDEMDANNRGKLRGVKLEVNAIRNAVLKANQRRHEYASRKEEQEQLKKLGMA